ncbi:TonB-dependent receptor [Thiohalophilus sp.]|uniref:TonB-dependent receptor n=1 Tax=Thiohalophilus sp. TaxID=3028392 RepID=UPI002ACEAAD3|nr:TonB-dependent receptor [Thiohalophilus sp.]MDZ7661927.1 TonB-dependent receptor [Thiohalophilus sp.]MDZ7803793.1 TonB-dependent receptor [Thiohalophilus sp.]
MHQQPLPLRKTLLATLIAAFAHGTAIAEEAIPTISVTAPPLTESRDVNRTTVSEETLQMLAPATSDSASLLKNLPGLTIQGSGGVSGLPVIRGLADDRLRIKVDGMDLISACGNHMNPPLSYIDPSNVDSATVFAGISPVSVGGDSIGGTVLVDSPAPQFAQPGEESLLKGEAGFFYRSNGNAYGDNLSATAANEKFSLTYTSSTTESGNYSAGDDFKTQTYVNDVGDPSLDSDEVGSTRYKSTNRSLSLAMLNDNHLTEFKIGMQDIPYQGWSNQRMDMTGNDSTQFNLNHTAELDWGTLEARAYHERTRHSMQFYDDKLFWYGSNDGTTNPDGEPCTLEGGMNGCAAGMPMDTEGNNSGLLLKADIVLSGRDLLRVGTEAQQYRLDDWMDPSGKGMWPDTFININDGERDRLALFGEWEAQWDERWLTQLGLRYEQVKMDAGEVQGYNATYLADETAFNDADRARTDDNFDFTALARFTPDASRTIEFGLAQKSRSPNLYERYTWSTGGMAMRMINWAGDGNGYVGNLELDPEIARTVSAAFSWHDAAQKKWELKVSPYYTRVKDYIDAERCSGAASGVCTDANLTATEDFVYLQFVNQEATLYGLDISGHFPLAQNTPYGNFTATGMLNYVRGENEDTGDNLYNIMPLNARLAVVQQKGAWQNTVEVELVDSKEDVSATRNEMQTESYGLLHLRSSYTWKQARFDVGIENVFDEFYNHPLGGAYLGEGKTMSGSDVAWGTPVPGMGRSIYAGVNIKF